MMSSSKSLSSTFIVGGDIQTEAFSQWKNSVTGGRSTPSNETQFCNISKIREKVDFKPNIKVWKISKSWVVELESEM